MTEYSRRAFLARTGAGVATAGFLAAVPGMAAASASERPTTHRTTTSTPDDDRSTVSATGPLVVHIPDPSSGEVHFMIGTSEVVRKDRALVAKLLRDAR
jgi:hypothetical protein